MSRVKRAEGWEESLPSGKWSPGLHLWTLQENLPLRGQASSLGDHLPDKAAGWLTPSSVSQDEASCVPHAGEGRWLFNSRACLIALWSLSLDILVL